MLRNLKAIVPLILLILLSLSSSFSARAQAPLAAFNANDTIVCIGSALSFTDASVAGANPIVNWDWSFGDGGTSTNQDPTYTFNTAGTFITQLIITDAVGLKDTATQTIYVVEANVNQSLIRLCAPTNSTTISAVEQSVAGVNSYWLSPSPSVVIANSLNDTTLVSNLASGLNTIFWVVAYGSCTLADQVSIYVDTQINSNAGPDQQICSTPGTTNLAGNNPNPGIGLWTTTSTATITNPNNRNSGVTGLNVAGTYTFVWTITNGACISRDTMVITVSSPVVSNAGVDQAICTTTGTATLVGSNPSPGLGAWTTSSTATIASPLTATTAITGLTTAGNYNFIWTITNGTCVTRDTIRIVVTTPVVSNAGSDIQVCTSTATGTLNGNNPSPGSGLWTAVTSGTITSPSSSTTTVTGLSVAGFYSFVWTITNGPCISRDTITIIVRNPVVANAGADQIFCNTSTATLTGNSPSPGTALWTTTGSATITSPSSASTTVSNLAFGNNTFIYTTSYGACLSRDTIIIRRDSLITSNAGPDQQICESTTSITLAGNSASPGSGVWTKTNGGTITTPSNATSTVTGLTAGTHSFIWTITNGSCISRDTMRVVVNTQVASNAGLDDQVCQGSTSSLSGNNPSPAIGLWTTTSSATIATPSLPNTNISGLTNAGVYTFIWSVTNGACILRDTARVTVDSSVIANAGIDKRVCTVNSTTLVANTPTLGTGLWTSLGSAGISNPNFAAATATNLVYGNNLFVWTITNGSCINRDTINVIRDSVITARAGADRSICSSALTVNLAGNTPASGSGLWTTTSLATITTPSSPTSAITGYSTPGSYTFVWTITNGSCTSRDTVVITVDQAVTANAGADQSICSSTSSITMAGSNPAPGTGIWNALGAGAITSPNSANTNVTALGVGTNIFTWTIINGVCNSEDTVVINVSQLVTSNAGPNQTVCQGASVTLSGNSPSPGTGAWSALNGGTISNPTNQSPTVTGLSTAGTYNFVWTITNGSCVSRDTVAIIVSALIASNAGVDQSLCAATTATLAGNNPAPGTGTWTSLGTALVTSPSNQNSGVTALVAGANSFVWTIVNGGCTSRDTVIINRSQLVTSNAGPNQTVCQGTTVTLSGNSPSPGTGAWSALNGGTISSSTSQSPTVTGLSTAGTYNFVWTITNGSCVSRDTVTIIVSALIASNAGVDQSLCAATTATLAGNNPAPGTGTWTSLGTALVTSPSNQNSGVTALVAGANSLVWTIVNGGCTSRDTVLININTIIPVNAGIDQQLCSGSTIGLSANNPSPGSGTWSALNGGVITSSSNPATTITGISTAGNYNFVWTVINGSCTSRDTVLIQISDPVAANAGNDQQICNTFNTNLSANNPSPGTGLWTTSSSAVISSAANQSTAVSGLSFGSNEFIWTITNGSCVTKDTLYIVVDSIIVSDAGADQQVCAGTSTILSGSDAFPAIGIWTALNGGLIGDSSALNTTVDSLNFAGSYAFVWTITNGVCISPDTTLILVDSLIIADAGVDQKFCEIFNTVLAANNFTPGFGTWSTSGSATIVDPNDPATAIINLSYGVNEFIWTIDNGTCSSADTVIVNVDSLIIANAGVDQTICAGSLLTLVGNFPGLGESDWVAVDAGTIADPSLQTISISDLNISGIYSFEYSISNGVCFSLDTVIVTVDSLIAANAGADQALCNIFTTILGGNTVSPGIGFWSTLGSATFTDVNDPLTDVANLNFGDNIFIWSVTNGVCSSEDTVTIHVDSIVAANAGTDQTICSSVGTALMNANDPLAGQGLWTSTSSAVFADSSLYLTSVSGLNFVGSYQLVWTITNGVCISTDTIIVNVDSNEIANAGVDQQYCETITSANLNANAATVGVGFWTSLGSATVVDGTNPITQVDSLVLGDNLFVYTITNGTCITTDTSNINISQLSTAANAGIDQEQCASVLNAVIAGNIPLVGIGNWTSLGIAIVDSSSSVSTTVSNLQVGNNLFVYSIANGACISEDTINILINPLPLVDAGLDQFVTSLTPVIIGGAPTASNGSGAYNYAWSPSLVLNDSTLSNPTATVNSTTLFTVLVTDSLGCQGIDTVIVWINNPPIALNDTLTINEDSIVVIDVLLNDTDLNNNINPASVSNISGPFNGSIVIDTLTGIITYTPNANYYGADSIFYTVCDSGMPVYCDTAWIYINILPINDAPLAIDDTASTVEDSCIQIAVLANDSDVENSIIVSSLITFGGPSNGTLTLDTLTGIITYCPDSNFAGVDTFYYAICDSGYPAPGLCDTAIVIITVNTNNDPPIALNDSAVICSSDSVIISILGNDFDPENDSLSASILTPPSNGNATIGSNFDLFYYPDSLFNGIDSVQYIVCDNQSPAGCDTAWVYVTVHGVPQINLITTDVKCFGDSSGTIDLTITGNAPYIYTWSNGSVDEDIDSLYANTYIILVTDTFGCTNTSFATVSQPLVALSGLLNVQPILCNSDSSGAFDLVVSGGTSPYTYTWSNGATDEDIDSLVVGNYTVIVADSNGCIVTFTDSIFQPDSALSAIATVQDVSCGGDSTGAITINVVGGSPGYLFAWSNGNTTNSITNVPAGLYTVTIYDSNNCQLLVTDSILDINAPISIVPTVVNPNCIAGVLGSISIATSGGIGNYNYVWNTSDSTNFIDSLNVGSYNLTVSDSLGCSETISIVLVDSSSASINVLGNANICEGDSITLEANIVAGATYQWTQNGSILVDTTYQLIVDSAGTYDVTITTGCGVFTSLPINTTLNLIPFITASSNISVPCDLLITLNVSGATSYSWYPANLVSDSTGSIVTVNLDQTTTFFVTGYSSAGCAITDTIVVTVTCDTLFLPSGFSPNGDGINDFFVISNLSKYPNATLKIFNRWGNLVYIKDRYDNSWNGFSNSEKIRLGEELPNGTYFYVFEPNNGEENKEGFVILRR